jgi:hypothetical protein
MNFGCAHFPFCSCGNLLGPQVAISGCVGTEISGERRFQSGAKDRPTTVIHSVANCKVGFTSCRAWYRKSSSVALRINMNDIRMEMCATSTTVAPSVQPLSFNGNKNFSLA